MKRRYFYGSLSIFLLLAVLFQDRLTTIAAQVLHNGRGTATVSSRLKQFGDRARERWRPYFNRAGIMYPPKRVTLVGLKGDNRVEVYATNAEGQPKFIRAYDICYASGALGPKLRQGDGQVPEGVYRVSFLNPNSAYHVSLRLNYPNAFDQSKAKLDGRRNLGGDIMIHGQCVSIGCLAMRDEPAEDLFTLAADIGIKNVTVILAPFDLRTTEITQAMYAKLPAWAPQLYRQIRTELNRLPPK